MATDFFQRQDDARRNTGLLIVLFVAAVLGIVGAVVGVTYYACTELPFGYREGAQWSGPEVVDESELLLDGGSSDRFDFDPNFRWEIPLGAGLATLVLILGGTLFKVTALRAGGGTAVAEGLGGKRLFPDANDPAERRVLNVVEEMAIASGTPVPPVYLMEEPGINAFAAGFSPSDAVVGVTRGCVDQLSRDELQGVVAHEFSHILNGDMRMSIRLIGILHGILLLGLVGQWLLRILFYSGDFSSQRHRSEGSGKGGAGVLALVAVAVTLIVLGSIGFLFGGLIKAAVSRQREYLADASAVQFTRNPGGIAGALKRIGGAAFGSQVKHPGAGEVSHMFFATGVWEGFTSLMATHPPLAKRILAVEPNWDGEYAEGKPPRVAPAKLPSSAALAGFAGGGAGSAGQATASPTPQGANGQGAAVPLAVVDHAAEQIGEPTDEHRDYAHDLIGSLDPVLLAAVREPYGARAVIYALLLDADATVRQHQFAALDKRAKPDVAELTRKLAPIVDRSDDRTRLPIVDLSLPALRAMTPPQFKQFSDCLRALVAADSRLSLFEWTLARVLMRHLQPQFEAVRSPRVQYYGFNKLMSECSVLLSTLAYAADHGASNAGAGDQGKAAAAFAAANAHLPEVDLAMAPRSACDLNRLDEVLAKLATVAAKHRGRLVDACAEAICADGYVNIKEAELLRGVSDLLDCPMPPLLAGQQV